jgi:Tol biopolymer transport system component
LALSIVIATALIAALFLVRGWDADAPSGAGRAPESDTEAAATGDAGAVAGGQNPVHDGSPAWSPDSSQIAFYSNRDGNAEIYVMNADGSAQRRLTDHPADDGYPAWSPDGEQIAFDSDRGGTFDIYVMATDGSEPRRLTDSPGSDVSAAWSPDGARIAFMSNRSGKFEVFMMNADGSEQTPITSIGTNWFPQWSPDGSRLAFHVGRDVHVLDFDAANLMRLTVDPENGMYPTWSPGGTQIAFMSWRTGSTEIWVMNADGTDQRRLTETEIGDSIDPRWSPDGTKIAYVHVPQGMQPGPKVIHVMNADGSMPRRLTGR